MSRILNPFGRRLRDFYEKTNKASLTLLTLFVLTFLTSLIVFGAGGRRFQEVLAYFPDNSGTVAEPELQYVPGRGNVEHRIRLFTEEILLGPIDILKRPFINPATRIQSLFLNRRTRDLTISLSMAALQPPNSLPPDYDYAEAEALLKKNIWANFPFIGEIQILIGGQIPGQPAFQIDGMPETSGI